MLWKEESGFRGKRKRHTSCLQHACFGPPLMFMDGYYANPPVPCVGCGVQYTRDDEWGVIPKALA